MEIEEMGPEHDANRRLEAVRHVLATIFSGQKALRTLAPEFKWKGIGNLLGDYGGLIARELYGLSEAPAGSDGYDAVNPEGKTVQVKTNYSLSTVGF